MTPISLIDIRESTRPTPRRVRSPRSSITRATASISPASKSRRSKRKLDSYALEFVKCRRCVLKQKYLLYHPREHVPLQLGAQQRAKSFIIATSSTDICNGVGAERSI